MPENEPFPPKKIAAKTNTGGNQNQTILARFLFTTVVTTSMIVTGGYGTFPPNFLTEQAEKLFTENYPPEIVEPVNQVLLQLSAPTLAVVDRPDSKPNPNDLDNVLDTFFEQIILALLDALTGPPQVVLTNTTSTPNLTMVSAIETASVKILETAIASLTAGASQTLLPSATPALSVTEGTIPAASSTSGPTNTPQPNSSTTLPPIRTMTPIPTVISIGSQSPTPSKTRTQTPSITPTYTKTATPTVAATSTQTLTPTLTLTPTQTSTLTLTLTSTQTSTPTLTLTPTTTSTPTPTPTPSVGFSVSAVFLNGLGSSFFPIRVGQGTSVTVTYNHQVYNNPGIRTQLVTGFGTAGTQGSSCAYDNTPGSYPGFSGSENVTLTAPSTPGTYPIVVEYLQQPNCASALASYGTGSSLSSQTIGQIKVVVIEFFNGGSVNGNLGGRSGANATCTGANPFPSYTNVHAFISISDTDDILAMPSNYDVPTSAVLKFNGSTIANNWADLLDGTIGTSFSTADPSITNWWSGTENETGDAIGSTANCLNFTSSGAVFGNIGDGTSTSAGWMHKLPGSQSCGTSYTLVCIAYP